MIAFIEGVVDIGLHNNNRSFGLRTGDSIFPSDRRVKHIYESAFQTQNRV